MDNVDKVSLGGDNLDLMARQIQRVVMRIADYIDTKSHDSNSSLVARSQHLGYILQVGRWWIYADKNDGKGLAIRVDLSKGGLMLVSSVSGKYRFQQPSYYDIAEIRAKLPEFLAQMEAEFPDIKEWFQPFYDAAGV